MQPRNSTKLMPKTMSAATTMNQRSLSWSTSVCGSGSFACDLLATRGRRAPRRRISAPSPVRDQLAVESGEILPMLSLVSTVAPWLASMRAKAPV